MRHFLHLGTAIALITIAQVDGMRPPAETLFSGITSLSYDEARKELLDRLRPRYAIGASEAGMGEYLQRQGMSVKRNEVQVRNSVMVGQADITLPKGACGMAVHFLWRADREGNITELTGMVDDAGCF